MFYVCEELITVHWNIFSSLTDPDCTVFDDFARFRF